MLANFHPDAQAELNHAIDYYEANCHALSSILFVPETSLKRLP